MNAKKVLSDTNIYISNTDVPPANKSNKSNETIYSETGRAAKPYGRLMLY